MEEIFGTSDHATEFIIGSHNHLHHDVPIQKNDRVQNDSIDFKNDIFESHSSFEYEVCQPQEISKDFFDTDDHINDSFMPQTNDISHSFTSNEEKEDMSSSDHMMTSHRSFDSIPNQTQLKEEVLHEINLDDDDENELLSTLNDDDDDESHEKKKGFFNMLTGIKIPFMKSQSGTSLSDESVYDHDRVFLEEQLSKSRDEIEMLQVKLNEMMKGNPSQYDLENLKRELERNEKALLEANNNSKKWKQKYEDVILRYESTQEELSKLKEEMKNMSISNEEFDFDKRIKEIQQRYGDDLERVKLRFQNELEKEKKLNALDKNHNKQLIDKIKERAQKDIEFLQSQIESQNKIIEKLLVDNSELIDANALTRRIQIEAKVPGSLGAIVKENEMLQKMLEELEKKNEKLEKENENMKIKLSIIESRTGEEDMEWKISTHLITPITSTTSTPAPTPTQLYRA